MGALQAAAALWAGLLWCVAAAAQPTAAPRFVVVGDPVAAWLPPALFSAADRAAAAAAPLLRVAVPRGGVAAHLEVNVAGDVQGPQVQWLLATARVLGLAVAPVVVADEAAALQAVAEGSADAVLAALPPPSTAPLQPAGAARNAAVAPSPSPSPPDMLRHSLGTGAQPLAWVVLRELRPVPLERARIAHLGTSDPVAADRLRRHYPAATLLPQPDAAQALQAVVDRRADAYVGSLLPALAALQQQALHGLELRQVWPGAAGHRHLVLHAERAALQPAFNKAIAAWRTTDAPHRAVLRAAQLAAPLLRAPLALPADLAGADTAVMNRLLKAPFSFISGVVERLPLAEHGTWRVGVLHAALAPAGSVAAALHALDAEGQHTGVAADLVQELAQRLGLVVQLQPFDTEAAMLDALRAGRIDALPLLEHTPGRAQGLQFSLPWLDLPQVLVGADRGPLYWGLESLRGLRLAMADAHPLRAELQRLHPGIQLVGAQDGAAALALVREGQAEAALDTKPVVQQMLGSPVGQGLRVLGDVPEFTARYRVALPEAQRALLPLLDAALADIDAEERQRSLRRWLVHEPVPLRPWWQHPGWPAGLVALAVLLGGLAAWGWWRWWMLWRLQPPQLPAPQAPGVPPARQAVDEAADRSAAAAALAGGVFAKGAQRVTAATAPMAAWPSASVQRGAPPVASSPGKSMPVASSPAATAPVDGCADLQLEDLLRAVVHPLHQRAETAGQRLVWAVDEVLPARIHSDPARLAELVQLLLQRALALVALQGALGRVAFKVRRASLDNGHPALQLVVNASAVADTAEAEVDPRVLRALDLAVALGGDLVLRSRAGVGHAVSVRLPLRGASGARRPAPAAGTGGAGSSTGLDGRGGHGGSDGQPLG